MLSAKFGRLFQFCMWLNRSVTITTHAKLKSTRSTHKKCVWKNLRSQNNLTPAKSEFWNFHAHNTGVWIFSTHFLWAPHACQKIADSNRSNLHRVLSVHTECLSWRIFSYSVSVLDITLLYCQSRPSGYLPFYYCQNLFKAQYEMYALLSNFACDITSAKQKNTCITLHGGVHHHHQHVLEHTLEPLPLQTWAFWENL